MILGHGYHLAARCFDELDAALRASTDRVVCLNSHMFPDSIPPGAVVYNLEIVPPDMPADTCAGHELWDFSDRNVAAWTAAGRLGVKHVPVGYHPSMERFEMRPWAERDIDVVFCGCVNERRLAVLQALVDRDLNVWVIPAGTAYGAERDAMLARSKLALNMLYDPRGIFPVLRAAHCAANRLPFVSERADETPYWATHYSVPYERLVEQICAIIDEPFHLKQVAEGTYRDFRAHPFTLPGEA